MEAGCGAAAGSLRRPGPPGEAAWVPAGTHRRSGTGEEGGDGRELVIGQMGSQAVGCPFKEGRGLAKEKG